MATKIKFGNKIIQLPGSYSRIISGQNNPPRNLDYGKLIIIDNDVNGSLSNQQVMGGSGINGELYQGINSITSFTDINPFRDFVGRGWWWKAAQYLFNPDGNGNGVSEIIVTRPATTTSAIMEFNTLSLSNGGKFVIKTKDESLNSNAVTNEVRAISTTTISAAGTAADVITIKVSGVIVATYTVVTSDTIQLVVNGLVASATSLGICGVVSSNATTLVLSAPVGLGVLANSITPTIEKTGTVNGSVVIFAGGVSSTNLISGYAYTMESGVFNSSKWIMKIWKGSFKGLYSDGLAYDGITAAQSKPVLIAQSPEFNNIQELIDWGNTDSDFGFKFVVSDDSEVFGTGVVVSGDVSAIAGYSPASGATETYDSLDDTLEAIKEIDYNYVITTTDIKNIAADTDILKILNHLKLEAKYDKFLMLPILGTNSISESVTLAETFNSEKVNLVFDSILERSNLVSSGFRTWDSFYHSCLYLGRVLGIAPEIPLTFKKMNIDGVKTPLTEKQKEQLDEAGILCTIFDQDFGSFICLHDVNTLQDNDFVLTNEGLSHLIQIERIKSQLNKELIVNSKIDLLSDSTGVNRSSLTTAHAIEWTKIFLQRKIGSLIVEYRNVTATVTGDVILVDYEAMPNSEIKGIFFTGRLYL
jgi:hypothetical protein